MQFDLVVLGPELKLFIRFSQFSVAIPLVLWLMRGGSKRLSWEQNVIGWIAFLSLLTELSAVAIVLFAESPNNWLVYHIYTLILFVFMNRLYKGVLTQLNLKFVFDVILALYICFAVLNSLYWQSITTVNSNTIVASSIIYILFSLAYFYQLIRFSSENETTKNPMLWINIGVLIYNSGSIVLFLLVNRILKMSEELIIASWSLNAAFNLVLNILFAKGVWSRPKQ